MTHSAGSSRIALLGLGEAGLCYAAGLAQAALEQAELEQAELGHESSLSALTVTAFDPYASLDEWQLPAGVTRTASLEAAVSGADLVLSVTGAVAATHVAAEAAPHMKAGAVFADLNTGSPELKLRIAEIMQAHDVVTADVAVLSPVPRAGLHTPLAVSGLGAEPFASLARPLGMPVDVVGARPGDAARLKLLRSVFMKGLATLMVEGLQAADAFGSEPWLRAQIAAELGAGGDALVERMVTGTYRHAERREHEMRDALAELTAADLPADMTRASLAWFERIVAERHETAESRGASAHDLRAADTPA